MVHKLTLELLLRKTLRENPGNCILIKLTDKMLKVKTKVRKPLCKESLTNSQHDSYSNSDRESIEIPTIMITWSAVSADKILEPSHTSEQETFAPWPETQIELVTYLLRCLCHSKHVLQNVKIFMDNIQIPFQVSSLYYS